MDLGEVPEELKGLTEIEEMLIAQIFPIALVYCLHKIWSCEEYNASDTPTVPVT
ncbi:hypothetical protein RhiirA1_467163 [Rhizophagus irregularis]|uniref:DUF6570 domain-containing protein n=1 Tax=Rhizophagus irregularis TaxID=588596 RepID=A0A2I1E985_9GLOM|nr:hypothetical protein RhiirA1_467163 [Rhizophagus irregularis]PKY18695.1 hypothetical protein RhiirB3_431562 [Rhizophagus irregularis]